MGSMLFEKGVLAPALMVEKEGLEGNGIPEKFAGKFGNWLNSGARGVLPVGFGGVSPFRAGTGNGGGSGDGVPPRFQGRSSSPVSGGYPGKYHGDHDVSFHLQNYKAPGGGGEDDGGRYKYMERRYSEFDLGRQSSRPGIGGGRDDMRRASVGKSITWMWWYSNNLKLTFSA